MAGMRFGGREPGRPCGPGRRAVASGRGPVSGGRVGVRAPPAERLSRPMTVSDLLFDTPWWLPTAIIAVGLFVFLSGNKRTVTKVRNVGLAVVGVGLLLVAVSYLVDTDKEKVVKRSRELVKDVEGREWEAATKLMAPDVHFEGYGMWVYDDRTTLLDSARAKVDEVGLNSATVTA